MDYRIGIGSFWLISMMNSNAMFNNIRPENTFFLNCLGFNFYVIFVFNLSNDLGSIECVVKFLNNFLSMFFDLEEAVWLS